MIHFISFIDESSKVTSESFPIQKLPLISRLVINLLKI